MNFCCLFCGYSVTSAEGESFFFFFFFFFFLSFFVFFFSVFLSSSSNSLSAFLKNILPLHPTPPHPHSSPYRNLFFVVVVVVVVVVVLCFGKPLLDGSFLLLSCSFVLLFVC